MTLLPALLSLALASNATGKTLGRRQQGIIVPSSGSGRPLLTDDAGTRFHVWFAGAVIRDTKGITWTENSAVPRVAKNGVYPAGAGPFTDAAYFSGPVGGTTQDLCAGDCTLIIVYSLASRVGSETAFSATNGALAGYNATTTATTDRMQFYDGSGLIAQTAPTNTQTGLNVACHGRAGSNAVSKLNLGTYTTAALGRSPVTATTQKAFIGRTNGVNNQWFGGTIYEILGTTTTPSDAACTAIATSIKAQLGITTW